ncbi:uroporphyrinogen-III C-methyltransferase [Armatimonas sp.]|uniref:uroporphyrinogen-III C-methyltransferase n=1 Tax=Armatimonas sp. TaxID=1872638 RepID=UPI003751344F
MSGFVYLVGAGPGDPELITLKGLKALQSADVVLYDRLAAPELLEHAPSQAERIYAGKDLGTPSQPRQDAIHEALVHHAKLGKTVVRLKGGDPFVFGRGSEEAAYLTEHGISYAVIPGISSAIAGPGAAGIPVTHRGVSAGFCVFAGQEGEANHLPETHWQAAALIGTAVFLMGVSRLSKILEKQRQYGRPENTPVALIASATYPGQKVVTGTLATIESLVTEILPPAIIVIGEVVDVRGQLGW